MESTGPKRSFPPPWSIEKTEDRFIVKDANGLELARIPYWDGLGQWTYTSKHLASDEARWVTGSLLQVAGGLR